MHHVVRVQVTHRQQHLIRGLRREPASRREVPSKTDVAGFWTIGGVQLASRNINMLVHHFEKPETVSVVGLEVRVVASH